MSEDVYVDRGTALLTPSRGMIHATAYAKHMGLRFPIKIPRRDGAVAIGLEVGVAYCRLFKAAITWGAPFALTLEDDMLPEPDVVSRLHQAMTEQPEFAAISALYYTKTSEPTAIVLGDPSRPDDLTYRDPPENAGLVEVNVIPMGCALWRLSAFDGLEEPWFKTTDEETQDVYACLKMRARGHRFAVDTRIRVQHLDARTGKVY